MERRRNRNEQARRRTDKKRSSAEEEQQLKEKIRQQNLYDFFMKKALNLKHILVKRSKELELRANYFIKNLSPDEKLDCDHLNTLLFEQGVLGGRLHQMKVGAFKELQCLKTAFVEQGVDKKEAMDGELAQIEISFLKLKDCSDQLSAVLTAHLGNDLK